MYICDFLCTITKPRREWQRIQISSRGNTLFHEWSLHTQLTEHFWTRQTNVRLNSKTMHLSYVWRVKSWRDIYHFKWKSRLWYHKPNLWVGEVICFIWNDCTKYPLVHQNRASWRKIIKNKNYLSNITVAILCQLNGAVNKKIPFDYPSVVFGK